MIGIVDRARFALARLLDAIEDYPSSDLEDVPLIEGTRGAMGAAAVMLLLFLACIGCLVRACA